MDMPKNVSSFITKVSEIVGNYESEIFSIGCWQEMPDLKIDSPIEMLFYVAINALRKINRMDGDSGVTVSIQPQRKIEKYRVDFVVSEIDWRKEKTNKSVIVECDGHEFHEKDEKARRYEKQRDRKLQSLGWKIFRFTGKEITDNPVMVAAEVLSFVTNSEIENLVDVNFFTEFYV